MGEPDIQISELQVWVHGRQFPDADDYWDGNWLLVTAHCGTEGSSVWVSGPIIHLSELHRWLVSCRKMEETLGGEANLECMEPELSVTIKAQGLGHLAMEVQITPNHLQQEHTFRFEIDQSYLPNFLGGGQTVLSKYPIRGNKEKAGT